MTAASIARPISMASAATRERIALALVIFVTLAVELALVERKYAIIGGGFGQSQPLVGAASLLLFALALLASHAIFVTALFLVVRLVHRRVGGMALFPFNFAVLVSGLMIAALAAKYEVLSYFSDAISFQLIKNLGGGSLFDALLFVMSEGALMLAALAMALALYVLVMRRFAAQFAASGGGAGLRIPARVLGLGAMVAVALIAAGNRRPDVRSALGRFNAYYLLNSALDEISDVDRDGYGLFSQPPDLHPFDGARYPFALDVPGNGIDEDGIGGDFTLAPGATRGGAADAPPALPPNPRHLILIVLESTRQDALGRVVGGREVTPNLNALARSGSSFPAAYSHVGFTTASLKSLFSGRLETAPGGPSLFRDLKANGYRIGVFSGQPESFGDVSEAVGMRAASDVFADAETLKAERAFGFAAKGSLLVDGKVLLREFDRSFGKPADWRRPVFLYFNLQSAHFPYHHPGMEQILPGPPIPRGEISLANRAWVARTYWNAVAQADAQVGQLIARLKALGVYDRSLIVVTADHGESLFDDGFLGHGHMLNRQQTHIPLVVSMPGVARAAPVGLSDYRALILRLLGDQRPPVPAGPVLQYIGTLDQPSWIGIAGSGQRWTTLRLQDEQVRFSETDRSFSYGELAARPALKARADQLILAWEHERWLSRSAQ
jgi:hypothetical protein